MNQYKKDIQLISLEVISGKQKVIHEFSSKTYATLIAEQHNRRHLELGIPMHEVYVLYSKSRRTFTTIDPYFGHKKRVRQIDAYLMKIEFCQEEYREHPQLESIDYDQFKFVRGENLV